MSKKIHIELVGGKLCVQGKSASWETILDYWNRPGSADYSQAAFRSIAARVMGASGGAIGGKSTSPEKQAAARSNGKRGGRPRKNGGCGSA